MSHYDLFAPFYDQVMGDRSAVARTVRSLLSRAAPGARSVLELGCGTGSILKPLSKHYDMVGVDRSAAMLNVARAKVPNVRLLRQDISRLRLDERFDAIICIFDTMNHLPDFRLWKRVFERARTHLSKDGVFLFDVNTVHKIQRYAAEPAYALLGEESLCVIDVEPGRRGSYVLHLRAFSHVKGRQYHLFEERLPGIAIPTPVIVRELRRHFSKVRLFDPDRSRPSARSEELYFICTGPRT